MDDFDKNQGWIKLYRNITDWEWFDDSNVLKLFIYCLCKANFEDKKWKGITIRKGSFITSHKNLSIELNMSVQQVRTSLKKLILSKNLTSKTTNKYTMISVCKYEDYQDAKNENNKQPNKQITNKQQTNNKQITTTKELKERKELKENIYIKNSEKLKIENPQANLKEFENLINTDWFNVTAGLLQVSRDKLTALHKKFVLKIKSENLHMTQDIIELRRYFNNWAKQNLTK